MSVSRRHFLKCCVGCVAAIGLECPVMGTLERAFADGGEATTIANAVKTNRTPSYPIANKVHTTLEKTIVGVPLPDPPTILKPSQVAQYAPNGYGVPQNGPKYTYVRPELTDDTNPVQSVPDPSAVKLLSFFTISDIHITDKECPALATYLGYNYPDPKTDDPGSPSDGTPVGNSSAYSAVMLYTTQVLDAAIQTINALHRKTPFDFGMSLGDAANNTQHNELRWYIDVIDGKLITPSSGDHKGADTIDYQKSYRAAGLDKSIPWYQTIGNHDQFWMGSSKVTDLVRNALVGPNILSMGVINSLPPDFSTLLGEDGYYMGVVDGTTEFGELIGYGDIDDPPQVAADPKRYSLSLKKWMREFFNTTTLPVGHGFTSQNVQDGFACYSFKPKGDIPIKIIVLDDTDKVECGAAAGLDAKRYNWLVRQLQAGETAGELMIVCAHIPIHPYAQCPATDPPSYMETMSPASYKSTSELLATLHSYKNLIMWVSGHVHRNTITPQPSPDGDHEKGFWVVETPSLRDFPRQLRRFDIVRNSDNNISIFALDVDPAANTAPLPDGSASPALTSLHYAIAAQQIFDSQIEQGANVDPNSGVYNAELVVKLTRKMRAKLASLIPVVSSFKINNGAETTVSRVVTLNNTVTGTTPTHYKASESSSFTGAAWLPYSNAPSFTLSPTDGSGGKTVYFRVKDGSGKKSAVVSTYIYG